MCAGCSGSVNIANMSPLGKAVCLAVVLYDNYANHGAYPLVSRKWFGS